MRTEHWLGMFVIAWAATAAAQPFAIRVVDEETGRGVPLVELKTTNSISYYTDSTGLVAIDEPGLLGQRVFFSVSSHGYEFPKDGFGFRGKALELTPGGEATLKIKRLNIAERLYRITGQGIYADTVRLGREAPIAEPVLNAQVSGQDSVQTVIYLDKLYWFWGDTSRPAYPLGHFGTAGAVSDLPGHGGLDPAVGVNLHYFADEKGFSRPMFQLGRPGPVWTDGVFTVADHDGKDRLVCHYSRMQDLGTRLEHGLAAYDDEQDQFIPIKQLDDDARLFPQGQAFRVTESNGAEFICFSTVYPLVRVRANWDDVLDPARYEALTPLKTGSAYDKNAPALERDGDGRLIYGWKPDTALVPPGEERRLVQRGVIKQDESRLRTLDVATGEPIQLHGGSVNWSEFRQRWVMIALQTFGSPSVLGEIYYLESEHVEGPWTRGVKIVTHTRYSFYNPTQHVFFNQEGGRSIYFEGTYTDTFSGDGHPTPRYDYNQIMYRLDLADERLEAAQ